MLKFKNKREFAENALQFLFDWVGALVAALVALVVLFIFLFRVVEVDGHSMNDTLTDKDRLVLWTINYTPERGDIVVVDRSLEPTNNATAVCFIDGEFTLKQFKLDEANHCAWLIPANENYSPIKVTEENDFMVWGVITSCIKRFHKF